MKKLLSLSLALLLLFSCMTLIASAAGEDMSAYQWEVIDDTDRDYIDYFSMLDEEHECGDWENMDDAKDDLLAFSWFQGGHLYMSSGHFAHAGSYAVITFTGVKIEWHTQYRGPAGSYSSSAAVYLDGELVAELGEEELNGENLTNDWIFWESDLLEEKEHVVKIVNTADPETESGKRLPIDSFKIYYSASANTETLPAPYVPTTKEPEPKATEAPKATDAPAESKAPAADTKAPEEKKGCGSSVAALALLPMMLAAGVVCKKH